jgi:spore coat protein CotH
MKKCYGIVIVLISATLCLGQIQDSSDFIFNDTIIQKYDLSFYGMEKWNDTLETHKITDEEYIPARVTWHGSKGDSITLDSVGVRYKGNSSYNYAGANPKKPYKLKFDKYKKKQNFFDIEILNFSNLVGDPSCMREKISYDFCRKFVPVSRATYALISVDSKEIGLFLQVEEIDDRFLERNFKNKNYNLYKSSDDGASLKYQGANRSDYAKEYDLKTNTTQNDWFSLIQMLDKLNNTPNDNFVNIVGNCLDLDICIRYLAYNMVTSNFDSYTGSSRNFYLYDDQISKLFKLIPWDFNLGLGNYANNWNVITVDAFDTSNVLKRPLAMRILGIDTLKQAYGRYINYMIDYALCLDTFTAVAERIKPVIDSAVKNDPNSFYSYDQFLGNIEGDLKITEGPTTSAIVGIKSFPLERYAELKKQLAREKIPVLNPSSRSSVRGPLLRCTVEKGGKSITVQYSLIKGADHVTFAIHNAQGKLVHFMVCGTKPAGSYTNILNSQSLSPGFFSISLNTDRMNASSGVILIKD